VLIPEELNPTGFTRIWFVELSILTITDDAVVPIPTERFGITFNLIKSSLLRPWEVDTETVVFIDFAVAVIWSNVSSKRYVSVFSVLLPDPANPLKYISLKLSPIPVLIPITFLDLFTA